MAFDFGKVLNAAADKALAEAERIMLSSLDDVAKKVEQDMKAKAESVVAEYYANSPKKKYSPKGYLKRSIHVESIITNSGKQWSGSFIVVFEPYYLPKHKSNSKFHQSGSKWIPTSDMSYSEKMAGGKPKQFGAPENSWIMEQFLEGIHPWSNVQSVSATERMEDYVQKEGIEKAQRILQDEIEKRFAKYLKTIK